MISPSEDTARVPVSPVASPSDTTLFEQGDAPEHKLYLPRYRIIDQPPQRVSLAQGAEDWSLTVDLETYRAPELDTGQGRDSAELPHTLSVALEMSILSGGAVVGRRQFDLPELTDLGDGEGSGPVRAVLRGTDSNVRDQIHLAMTDQEYGAVLLVRRVATIAVPTSLSGGVVVCSGERYLPQGTLFDLDLGTGTGEVGADISWLPPLLTPVGIVRLGHMEGVRFDDLTAADLMAASSLYEDPIKARPDMVLVAQTGDGNVAKLLIGYARDVLQLRWQTVTPAEGTGEAPSTGHHTVQEFRATQRVAPDPFVFPPSSPVFAGLRTPGRGLGLRRHDLPFRGRVHSYYQDLATRWVFYYLPDQLRLARLAQRPHPPAMTVQINAVAERVEETTAVMRFSTLPHVDQARLDQARSELGKLLPASLPAGVDGPALQALRVDSSSASLTLHVPQADGTVAVLPRANTVVNLRDGITDSLSLPLSEFRTVYHAMFAGTDLLRGDIELRLGRSPSDVEHVGLVLRLDQTIGAAPLAATAELGERADVTVAVVNTIESPVRVSQLGVRLVGEGATVRGVVSGVTPVLPTLVPPAGALTVVVRPEPAMTWTRAPEIQLDLDGVLVEPDPERIWMAILSRHAPNTYLHPITVEVFGAAFVSCPDHPQGQAIEINIEFDRAEPRTTQIVPTDLGSSPVDPTARVTRVVAVHTPIIDWLLNSPRLHGYSYRITTVRTGGVVVGPWTTAESDILPIQVVP